MAKFYSEQNDNLKGELFFDIVNINDGHVSVVYQPSLERLRQAGKNLDDIKSYRETLFCWFGCGYIQIFPLNTLSNDDFMQPKYNKIQSILLRDFDYKLPKTIDDVKEILENLPDGFIKDYDYGLGLQKDYRFIINAIEKIEEVEHLVIGKEKTGIRDEYQYYCLKEKTSIDYHFQIYYLNIKEYSAIRKGIKKISTQFQAEVRLDKSIFAYNALLNTLNPTQYPAKHRPYKKDSLIKFISCNDMQESNLSTSDQKEIVNLVSKNKKNIVKRDPTALIKLCKEIELVTLENLIERFAEMLLKDLPENTWQKFFSDNPFILSSAFSYPIIKFDEQVCVGGRMFSGAGYKIADFLFTNNSTDNSAIIEIKKPSTDLLNNTPYRGSVYSPCKELSGSINQLLDQKYKFQQEITQFKANERRYDIESYSINCLLIIGKTPQEPDQKKSFELFRGNSKDIEIITFDELLEKLKQLHSFLSPNIQDVIVELTDADIPF